MASINESDHRAGQVLRMAARGWRLFPVAFRDKQPLIADWPNQATHEEERIRFWMKRFSDCNWGVATGPQSGVFVLDVDGEDELNSLRALERSGCELPHTRITHTSDFGGEGSFRFRDLGFGRRF